MLVWCGHLGELLWRVPAGARMLGGADRQGNTGVVKAVLARQMEGFKTGSSRTIASEAKGVQQKRCLL